MVLGRILAQAGMREGMHVTFLPSYGSEMRGGTANVQVILSDAPISSPLIVTADALIAMNEPSVVKFAGRVRPGGIIVINESLGAAPAHPPENARVCMVPCTQMAIDLGNERVCSMIALGRLVRESAVVPLDSIVAQMKVQTAKYAAMQELNERALRLGYGG